MRRRRFLEALGGFAGAGAVSGALAALGLAPATVEAAALPEAPGARRGRVVVLGAGVAGLCVAWELRRLGHEVVVLEAQPRVGGRVRSVRRGDTLDEVDGPRQVCAFDPGQYVNVGPARIPHHHALTLGYCRELGVPVEVWSNANDAAWVHVPMADVADGQPSRRLRLREARADLQGYVAELLAKATDADQLDRPLSAEDRQRLLAFLREWGQLQADLAYRGSASRGRGPADPSLRAPAAPLAAQTLADALGAEATRLLRQPQELDYQPVMFQCVGGNDRLPLAFARRLGRAVVTGAVVEAIAQDGAGATVVARLRGERRSYRADAVVCTIPLPVLRTIHGDWAPAHRAAIDAGRTAAAGKIGVQCARRFWEEDDGIFGGWSSLPRTPLWQMLYPSHGYLGAKGVLVGYYHFGERALEVGALDPAARLRLALQHGAELHPAYPACAESAVSIAWHRVPFQLGAWGQWSAEARATHFRTLLEPDRRVWFAGDHCSWTQAWMQGAFESARHVVGQVHRLLQQHAPA